MAWIILGLISGFLASKIVNKTGEGFFLDIGLCIVGAFIGGLLFKTLRNARVSRGLNLYSFLVAVLLVASHAIRGGARPIVTSCSRRS